MDPVPREPPLGVWVDLGEARGELRADGTFLTAVVAAFDLFDVA